jgi:NADH dehydrogenase
MKLCILGGGGFVGQHLVARLSTRGHHILLPTRERERLKSLFILPGVKVTVADIHDPDALRTLFAGMDAVINLVGILHGNASDFHAAHADLPAKVVTACRAAGVRRLLHMSALGADPTSASLYQRSKAEGERAVMAASDLAVTVFRPSVIFGPGDNFLSLFAKLLRVAPLVPLADGQARFQPVFVGDVARAFADSLSAPDTTGEVYNLCGPRVYTLAQLMTRVAAVHGRTPLILPLGADVSYWFARLMELKPGRKLMTRDNHYAMRVDNICPGGFPDRFGAPTDLEAVIDYLREGDPRRAYDRFRRAARR